MPELLQRSNELNALVARNAHRPSIELSILQRIEEFVREIESTGLPRSEVVTLAHR